MCDQQTNKQTNKILVSSKKIIRYSNDSCPGASGLYEHLKRSLGCTYFIYMYENLGSQKKYIYSSNWDWQNLLIGEKLINNCPIFNLAFNYLATRARGYYLIPWLYAVPSNKAEQEVCGLRAEHNIANGFGYAGKGYGCRESLAFGGEPGDYSFYKNFMQGDNFLLQLLWQARQCILFPKYSKNFSNNCSMILH